MSQSPTSASIDRTERTGSPGLVLLLATLLVGAAASFSFLPQDQAGRLTIGLLAFRGDGAERFRRAIEEAMRSPEGTQIWYLRVIHHLAQSSDIWTLSIEGEEWGEVDFPEDVAAAANAVGVQAVARGNIDEALDAVRKLDLEPAPRILITGSLYLAGEILRENGTEPV